MSPRTRLWLVLGAAVAVVALAASLAQGGDGAGTIDDRVREIASGLRCPVCQNLSVADSPSRLAGEMRSEIAVRLRGGDTPQEIRTFFVRRYGEWVLLAPTREGLNLLPWLVPIAGVVIGLVLWAFLLGRRPFPEDEVPTAQERDRIEADLSALEEPG